MTQLCKNCKATVPQESPSCPVCGEELDPFATIGGPPQFGPSAAPRPPVRPLDSDPAPAPPPPVPAPHRPEPDEAPAPPPRRVSRPAEAPARRPPPSSQASPRPRRPPSQPAPSRTAPPPAPPPPAQAPPPPPVQAPPPPPQASYPYAPPPPPPSGGLRGLLSRLMGGGGAAYPPGGAPPPGYPYPQPPYPPSGYGWAPAPPSPPPAAPAPEPSTPVPPPSPGFHPEAIPSPEEDEDHRTVALGANIKNLKIPTRELVLEIRDHQGQWHFWTRLGAGGMKVGRSDKTAKFAELNSMASRHMRVGVDGSRVIVEDLGSLNGVFVKLRQPAELEDGTRFRVGSRVVEFRLAEPLPAVEPLVSDDGEVYWSGDLQVPAYLEFVRPDGRPGLRVPLTKPDATVLGRESRPNRPVDVALAGDEMASGQHAAIRREGDRFFLEDLKSRNGTFLQLRGTSEIQVGDELLVGRVLLRVADTLRPH